MDKYESYLVAAMLFLAVGFGILTLRHYNSLRRTDDLVLRSSVLNVSAAKVIGVHPCYRGEADAPYTLVEFGDYQCPPCREANRELSPILEKCRFKLRFVFRNLPLVSIHKYAMEAAVLAAMARDQGKFWAMHDELYCGGLNLFDENDIRSAVVKTNLSYYKVSVK
jgi:hypothetical protein